MNVEPVTDLNYSGTMEEEKVNCNNETSLEEFIKNGFKTLVEATKSANKLPFGRNRDLYESCPTFHTILNNQEHEILSNLSNLLKYTGCKGNIGKRDDEDKFEMIVDVNDTILERVSIALDEISGVNKKNESDLLPRKEELFNGSWNKFGGTAGSKSTQVLNFILNQTKNMEKPQLKFKDQINNDPSVPFEPKINYKYNLLKPLAVTIKNIENGVCQYTHPYEFELEKFKPLEAQLVQQEPKLFKQLEETPLHLVTVKEDVTRMIDDLKNYKEISVDLEHHSYRSFQGFTCLMQISTRDTDYIIDTLALRSDLQELNTIFTDPSIVKVFHGADLDVLWLQRDLSLYVVNMFDTHKAVKLLNYPNLSLAYLLHSLCNVYAQKHYQLADWRIRPLPQELITYAREDTHYLLYIYDNLRNRLIEKCNGQSNLLESAIFESTRICLKTYVKAPFDKDGHVDIYHRSKKLFDNRQKFALKQLFEWRDSTARELDESLAYVLPNHMMLNISEILPREAQGILACCNPVPLPVRQNLLRLHQIILKARDEPLVKPILEEQRLCRYQTSVNSSDNPLHCPHDLNHEDEFRDDLPVLLIDPNVKNFGLEKRIYNYESKKPIVNIFDKIIELPQPIENGIGLSPYSKYKLAKKYSESVEEKSRFKDKIKCEKSADVTENKPQVQEKVAEESNLIETSTNLVSDANVDSKCSCKISSGDISRKKNKARTADTDESPPKKRKVSDCTTLRGNEDYANEILSKRSKRKKEKLRKKLLKRKQQDNQFIPYNYESVNFDQYTSKVPPVKKKNPKTIRTKCKKIKGNIKISI